MSENFLTNFKKYLIVKYENINENKVENIIKKENSKSFCEMSFNPKKLAPDKAGIESKKEMKNIVISKKPKKNRQ